MKNILIKLDHLLRMTDGVGLIEHATNSTPNLHEGYSVDDNARAIQVCMRLQNRFPELEKVLPIYLKFVNTARREGGLALDLEKDGKWKEDGLLSEHFGRGLSALAESGQNVDNYWKLLVELQYPRALAQAIGACRFASKDKYEMVSLLADRLTGLFLKNSTKKWQWFEESMTYDNGRLPMGLMWASVITKNNSYLKTALITLDFLVKLCWNKEKDCFSFPGNHGWFDKNGVRAIYDQQPVEAGNMVESCALAYKITKDKKYLDYAQKAMEWYLGRNIVGVKMCDEESGGIYDGFGDGFVNRNQGAEAILSYLIAYHALQSDI